MWRGESGGAVPRRFLRFRWNVPHAALFVRTLFLLPAECFLLLCLRRPHFFQQRKKWGKERRQKPMVFGFPFGRFRCGRKRFRRESAMGLPSLPLTWWAEEIGGSTDLSDYQIAHMPPAAVCAGAARWAAKYKEYALLRSVFCRTACQHAADKPAHCRAEHGSGSDSYRRVPEPVIARHPHGAWERQRR